jgi:hypothetical protein
MEQWQQIPEFPNYSVGDQGNVRNDESGRFLAMQVNQRGLVNVGLTRGRIQFKRSVPLLVAQAFVPLADIHSEEFDTPINVDGDRFNNCADNIMWRPFWFAMKYTQQFKRPPRGFRTPVEEVETKEWFPTSWDAAVKYGLLDIDIFLATVNRTFVWPTYQRFRTLD